MQGRFQQAGREEEGAGLGGVSEDDDSLLKKSCIILNDKWAGKGVSSLLL